ncbi:MarR family winged helix-turn-helix transcriptional regulator [Sphingopyxis sp.]|uniref:MarR family winged helix-turn-helix transcriptional regulator n=1 Tax=Sphingopyxis sp. TaxID=1908224 RepID=UPI003D113472
MTKKIDLIDALVADWQRERPGSDAYPMQVVGRIIRLGRTYEQEVSHLLRAHGVSYSDFDVLATLRRSGPPYESAPTELQHNVLLTSGAMTACLRRLESAGLIVRGTKPEDRRKLSAKLTPKGFAMVESLIDRRFALARQSLAGLDADQIAAAEGLLRRLGR